MLRKDSTGNAFPCAGRAFRAVAMPSHLDAFSRGAIAGMAAAGASSAAILARLAADMRQTCGRRAADVVKRVAALLFHRVRFREILFH